MPGIHGFSSRGESRWNSLVGWLKRSPNCSRSSYLFYGFNLSFRSWISINGYDWLRWPAFVRQPQVKVLWICYSATISQYTLSGKASLGIAVLSYWRSSYESGGFTLTGLLKSPCYGLFEYLPSSEGYSNLSFLYSTRSLKVQLINSNWRTVSICSAWLWNVIAKGRIPGSLDLPNSFQYAYTVSLYTHDSGSQVIDDSTIGGRYPT